MRKVLSIGLFLCAAVAVATNREAAYALLAQLLGGFPARSPAQLARDYGVMLLVLAMPTAVLAWGIWREARQRAKAEV
jgi:hypothetical protein